MTNDIIPITFAGGTGGAMLTQLLIKAKKLDFSDITLSKNGNAHSNLEDIEPCTLGIPNSDIDKITHIMNANVLGKVAPYFVSLHLKDLNMFSKYFNKIIRITYEDDDVEDLAYIFVMKNNVDIGEITDLDYLTKFNQRKLFLKMYQPYFKHLESNDNILYVRWKEIYNGNESELINTLADFTSIPKINFNENLINNWRHVTKASLAEIQNRI
jgi:hypothetical protein